MGIDDRFSAVRDQHDTINRIRSLGSQVNLTPGSMMVILADALLSVERGRLRETKKKLRHKLSDYAGEELDNFWGAMLTLQRLPGVEDVGDFVGDASYIERIQKMFLAGSMGISEEAVRISAEAGAGVPFRITKFGPRLVLTPLEDINPAQKMGALEAARRIAPASSMVEMAPVENTQPLEPVAFHATNFYLGEVPSEEGLTGPKYDGPNTIISASADRWDRAMEGSLLPGTGEPSQLTRGGSWHTPPLGFGKSATLTLSVNSEEITSRTTFAVSRGTWLITVEDEFNLLFEDRYINTGWQRIELDIPTTRRSEVKITLHNLDQELTDVFVKDAYVGLRLTNANREIWLGLGGLEGVGGQPTIIAAPPSEIKVKGGRWISDAHSSPSGVVEFFMELSGVPVRVSALQFKTETEGAVFRVEYSSQNEKIEDVTDWTSMPGVYRLKQGRVKIRTVRARHLKLSFTNLRPLMLKRFESGVF